MVPKTDADGNDVAGIRLPEIAVPDATYSGWNVRAAGYARGDLCNASGQKIPFAATTSDRRPRDPRLSVQERYPTHFSYVARVALAATGLWAERLLLPADVLRYVIAATLSRVGR
jgi:hypothetical protein